MTYPKIRYVCRLPTKAEQAGQPEHFDCAYQKHQIQIDPVRALPRGVTVAAIPGSFYTLDVLLRGKVVGWIKIEDFRSNVRGEKKVFKSVQEWLYAGSPQL